MTLHLSHAEGRDALLAELESWQQVLAAFDDIDAPSRCEGWTCGQLLVHVHLGLHEVALALLDVRDPGPVTIDAAGYWRSYPTGDDTEQQNTMLAGFVAAYPSATALTNHLGDTVTALRKGVGNLVEGRIAFQDFTFGTGDFLGSWAVELAVHHLDLDLIAAPPSAAGLSLARRTVDDLSDDAAPSDWDDATVVLAGTGRVPLTEELRRENPGLEFPVLR